MSARIDLLQYYSKDQNQSSRQFQDPKQGADLYNSLLYTCPRDTYTADLASDANVNRNMSF